MHEHPTSVPHDIRELISIACFHGPEHLSYTSTNCKSNFQVLDFTMAPQKEIDAAISQCQADSPPSIVPLQIKSQFEALTDRQKIYAHNISRLATKLLKLLL
jgi:hypothetical protein